MLFLIFFGLVAISGIILMMKYNDWKSVMGVVFLVMGGSLSAGIFCDCCGSE